jgi:hypothetical protein
MREIRLPLAAAAVGVVSASSLAAPGLPVTKPPVGPVPSFTGPLNDPHALSGQWFFSTTGIGVESVRTHEFYDNVTGQGGGFASTNAIKGVAQNLQLVGGNIVGFNILATITNDLPGDGPWLEQPNSHGEVRANALPYVGDMFDVKLSASFAILNPNMPPPGNVGPYHVITPFIEALNEDQAAWYCWTPGGQNFPPGNYYVPTWDFGNIPLGSTATRLLSFSVQAPGLAPTDPRFAALVDSEARGTDLLMNRTTSLKISDWLDMLALDPGTPYPVPANVSSDVSVFFNIPEPTSLALLSLSGLALLRRRR